MPLQVFHAIWQDVTQFISRHHRILRNDILTSLLHPGQHRLFLDLEPILGSDEVFSRDLVVLYLKIQLDLLVTDILQERLDLRAVAVGLEPASIRSRAQQYERHEARDRTHYQ